VPKTHLSDIAIRRLKAPSTGQLTYWDNDTKSFGVRVSKGGTKSFVVLRGTRRQRITIGRYPDIGLSDARREARRILSVAAPIQLPTIKFEQALDEFFRLHCTQHQRPTSTRQIRRLFEKHFLPNLHGVQLRDLSYEQISRLVHRLLDTPSEANHAFKAMRLFCRWAVRNRYLRHNPIEGMQMPAKVRSRDRFLSDAELFTVWKGAGQYGYPFGTIIKLLILTGQRRGEITSLQWNWINERAARDVVGIRRGAISGILRVASHTARSIG
jgi:integrase